MYLKEEVLHYRGGSWAALVALYGGPPLQDGVAPRENKSHAAVLHIAAVV
jgi:hypothetical protein